MSELDGRLVSDYPKTVGHDQPTLYFQLLTFLKKSWRVSAVQDIPTHTGFPAP